MQVIFMSNYNKPKDLLKTLPFKLPGLITLEQGLCCRGSHQYSKKLPTATCQ